MITVVIAFRENVLNFVALLTQLQPLLHKDDDIYVVDSSPNRDALRIVAMYGTTRCYIFVEPTKEDALGCGIQSMVENDQKALLFLDEGCFISSTLIANLKKIVGEYQNVSPLVNINPYYKMDTNYKHYNSPNDLVEAKGFSKKCFLMSRNYKKRYGLLKNEYVTVNKFKRPSYKL